MKNHKTLITPNLLNRYRAFRHFSDGHFEEIKTDGLRITIYFDKFKPLVNLEYQMPESKLVLGVRVITRVNSVNCMQDLKLLYYAINGETLS